MWWVTTNVLCLSLLINFISSIILYREWNSEKKYEHNKQEDEIDDSKESEWFLTIYSACEITATNLDNEGPENEGLISAVNPVLDLYRSQHQIDKELRKKSLNEIISIIRKVGMDPKLAPGANYIVEALRNLEVEELHSHNESEAGDCLKGTLKLNYSTYDYFLGRLERLGKFGQFKLKVIDSLQKFLNRVKLIKSGKGNTKFIANSVLILIFATNLH